MMRGLKESEPAVERRRQLSNFPDDERTKTARPLSLLSERTGRIATSPTRPYNPHLVSRDDFMDIWLTLDRISIVLSYAAFVSLAVAAQAWGRSVRRHERRVRLQDEIVSGRNRKPVALLVTRLGESTESDVRRFLSGTHPAWDFPPLPIGADDPSRDAKRWPLVHFEHSEKEITPNGVDADLDRLREVERWLKEEGFNEVHLFLRSTVAFGAAIGSLFTNWGTVHVYHFNLRAGTYEHWFPLADVKRISTPPTLPDALASTAAELLARRRSSRTPGQHVADEGAV